MAELTIERDDHPSRGSYLGRVPGVDGTARLDYRRERPDLIVAQHTESPESLRGQGVALALVTRMVEDARKEGVKIYAMCSYVERERRVHPEWGDVFTTER